jgi:hypothetical protein
MTFGTKLLFTALLSFLPFVSLAQFSSKRTFQKVASTELLQIDTLTIYPNSFVVVRGKDTLSKEEYEFNYTSNAFRLKKNSRDTLTFHYQVLPFEFTKTIKKRDSTIIYQEFKGDRDKFKIENTYSVNDIFGGTELTKNGSISRGVSFGNNQDLGVNSSLNLELTGNIAPNLKVIASVSDANLPIQPDGNTNKLQEFDQVFIQVYNDNMKIVAGDFWLSKPKGYFLSYKKRAQGLTGEYSWQTAKGNTWQTQVSGALSKGKFNRQIIQGIEANQGPYRLVGAENEPFILILAGTERVYIDGKLLVRGQEFDYVIDYNSSELTFTARNQITKDTRIVVEFQYSDQNYERSLVQNSTSFKSKKLDFWLNIYSEQDAKNQSLQQTLNGSQKFYLSQIGDDLSQARVNSIDSVGFIENQILYRLTDSLGYDSVLVFSVLPTEAKYRATFQLVGNNQGDYILDSYNALGKVYKWIAPVNGIPQGNFAPARLIITPKQKQVVSAGAAYKISKSLTIETENALSTDDVNTFSKLEKENDQGFAQLTRVLHKFQFGKDSSTKWQLDNKAEVEYLSTYFSPIEQYRKIEFDRDWNTRNKGFTGQQLSTNLGSTLSHKTFGKINLEGQRYTIGNQYAGNRVATEGNWNQKGWDLKWDGSALKSTENTPISNQNNQFIRHRASISKDFKYFKIGFIDDHELNVFSGTNGVIQSTSYQFFDQQFFLSKSDSSGNSYKIFYRERYDQKADSTELTAVAKATTAGGEINLLSLKNQKLTILTAYRELKIKDSLLLQQTPENSLVGRFDYEARWWKSALTLTTFYEVGSGLEQRRTFQYLKVNDGQGIYTWVDYNADGIKDLNEFEIAQFVDQASYIRVFTPSNEYVKTYSNEFNQSIYWRPEKLWNSKKGVLKVLSLFSNQARLRINRKLNSFDANTAFNPFATDVEDIRLVSAGSTVRNTLFFNRTSSVITAEYTFQDNRTKNLLASGFDSRKNASHDVSIRWNLTPKFSLEAKAQSGEKLSAADYTIGRNYNYRFQFLQPSFIYQPSTNFRIGIDGRIGNKVNAQNLGGETCSLLEMGSNLKFNQTEKGSLQGEFKMIRLNFVGNPNSAIGFELLESLKPGQNYTWNLGYQRTVSKNLQLTIQYLGRKSENSRIIHSGGMEVRAFF